MAEAPRFGDAVARQVRRYRKRRGLSVRQLAEACAALGGAQLTIASLANLERGQSEGAKRGRREVTVDELAILAEALGVRPMFLLCPVGIEEAIEYLPGRTADAWTVAKWFTGRGRLSNDEDPDAEVAAAAFTLYERHDALLEEYIYALAARDLFPIEDQDPERLQARIRISLRDLRGVRAEIRRHGFRLPRLPEDLQHVDERLPVYLTPEEAAARPPGSVRPIDYSETLESLNRTGDRRPPGGNDAG